MKRFAILLAVALTIACSHGRTPQFPAAADPAGAGQVFVIRNALPLDPAAARLIISPPCLPEVEAGSRAPAARRVSS